MGEMPAQRRGDAEVSQRRGLWGSGLFFLRQVPSSPVFPSSAAPAVQLSGLALGVLLKDNGENSNLDEKVAGASAGASEHRNWIHTPLESSIEIQTGSTADPEARAPNSRAPWRPARGGKPERVGSGTPETYLESATPRHPLRRRLGALMTSLRPWQTGGRLTPTPFSVAAPRAMSLRLHLCILRLEKTMSCHYSRACELVRVIGVRLQRFKTQTWLLPIFVTFLVVVQIWQDGSPPVVGRDASLLEFSAQRALDHLAQFSVTPHPMGSRRHQEVALYLESQVQSMGLQLQREPGRILLPTETPTLADVENLLVTLPGTDSTKAVLLTAHYDSVPGAPGTSDDGAGVATLLECMRVLLASPRLRNDVIFLFTDGEEMGLLGARQFVQDEERLAQIGVVLNFEGRGSRGPVWLFEASTPNEWIVRQFAQASPFPVGNSLSYEIYKRLPNDTDFSVFKRQGVPGFNFAYFGGISSYHTRLDNLLSLDHASLQHHGSYAVSLSRQLGGLDLSQIDLGDEVIYGNLIGNAVVYYSVNWVLPWLLVAWAVLVGALVLGHRRGLLTWGGFLTGLLVNMVLLVVGPLLVWGLWRLLWRFHPQRDGLVYGQPYASHWWMMGLVALGCIAFLLGLRPCLKRFQVVAVTAGIVTTCLLFSTLLTWFVPGTHFLFFWPSLGAVLALFIQSARRSESSWIVGLGLSAMAFPASMLPAQAGQLHEALTLNMVAAPTLVILFCLGTLSPQFAPHFRDLRLPTVGAFAALCFFGLALLNSSFQPSRPQANSLAYALQEGEASGYWLSTDSRPDEWTGLFLDSPEKRALDWLAPLVSSSLTISPAPSVSLPAIDVSYVLEDGESEFGEAGPGRRLRIRIRPGAEGSFLIAQLDPGTQVLSARVQGLEVPSPAAAPAVWGFRYLAPPIGGIEVELVIQGQSESVLRVVESRRGLPDSLLRTRRRPAHMMSIPYPYWVQDSTLISKRVRITLD